jgi:branched-chain amino acid transport system ATP-binding protein
MLEIKTRTAGYGAMIAVKGLSLTVPTASIVAILGANGAGKSTTLQSVAGHVPVWSGEILYEGHDLTRMRPEARVDLGVAIAPEGRRLFTDLTVRENLVVGGYSRSKAKANANMESVLDLFPRLAERINIRARLLSGGEQQMLAIGRALMADPSLLMIDEVSLGLMPKNVSMCYEAIDTLKQRGISILLVEQNVRRALRAASFAYIVESGVVVWSGPAEAALSDARVAELYLGGA